MTTTKTNVKVYVTDFAPNGVEHVPEVKSYSDEDIVEYGVEKKIVRIKDTEDFTEEVSVVEKSRYNRADFVNSFANDTGIDNVLKRLAINNDPEAIKALALQEGGSDIDLSKLPENYLDAMEFVKQKKEAYLHNMGDFGSIEEAAAASNEDIDAYINRKVAEAIAANKGGAE